MYSCFKNSNVFHFFKVYSSPGHLTWKKYKCLKDIKNCFVDFFFFFFFISVDFKQIHGDWNWLYIMHWNTCFVKCMYCFSAKIEKKENFFASTYPFGLKRKTVCMDSIINVKDFHRVKNTVLVNLSFYVTFI